MATGAICFLKAGAPLDSDFTNVIDGIIVGDTVGLKAYVRIGGVWQSFSSINLGPVLASGAALLLSDDEVQVSNTIPNADTAQKTYALGINTYTKILVEAEGFLAPTGVSAAQDINLKIMDAGVQKGNTTIMRASAASASFRIPFRISVVFVEQTAQNLTFTIGAAAADANTTIKTNVFRVWGIA